MTTITDVLIYISDTNPMILMLLIVAGLAGYAYWTQGPRK
jgi:hypothetical protein